jgi:hypothetical protein
MSAVWTFLGRDLSIALVAAALTSIVGFRFVEVLRSGVIDFGYPISCHAERTESPSGYWVGVSILCAILIMFTGITATYFFLALFR